MAGIFKVSVRYGVSQKSSDFWDIMSLYLSTVMEHYDGFIADFIEDFMKSIHMSEQQHYK